MSPTLMIGGVLGLLLALSVAGNAWLFNSRDTALEGKAKAETAMAGYKSAAATCSASVDKLAKDGKDRQAELLKALATAAGWIKRLQQEAIAASRAKPDNPADLCGSLERYLKAQIKAEREAK